MAEKYFTEDQKKLVHVKHFEGGWIFDESKGEKEVDGSRIRFFVKTTEDAGLDLQTFAIKSISNPIGFTYDQCHTEQIKNWINEYR